VEGHMMTAGFLKVQGSFKPEYLTHEEWAVHASVNSSVMLDKVRDDVLIQAGLSKEVASAVQKLRKASGILIDD